MDKLICVGKNYLDHAKELGDTLPEEPVLFLKPPSTQFIVKNWGETVHISLPKSRGSVHYECEIVARINHRGIIEAVTLGLDLTLRDLQSQFKKQGLPWELSKVFQNSAVIGPWIPISEFPNFLDEPFTFHLDGVMKQKGIGRNMRFSPEECLSFALKSFPLCQDDLLFTGTPAGVGPLQMGQMAEIRWGSQRFYQVKFQ